MKRVLIVTEDQYHLIINALNDLRTKSIEKNIDTTDINELLLYIIDKGKMQKSSVEHTR